jgi:hypothetical protein
MKFSQSGSITILIFVVALFFAGCSGTNQPDPSVTNLQVMATVTTIAGTPAVTPAPQPATTVQVKATESPVKVFNGEYHWVEYRENNTVTLPPNPRYQWDYDIKMERSAGNYTGTPATHVTITMTGDYPEWIGNTLTTTKDGEIIVEDFYYTTSTDRFLGGTETTTIKGIVKSTTDILLYQHNREDGPVGFLGITPFGEMNITLTDQGTESVRVPAGIYPDARKYTGRFRDGTRITFWVAPGIPVPVQYQFPNKYLDGENPFQSYELKGWG